MIQLYLIRRYSDSAWDIHIPLGFGVNQQLTKLQATTNYLPLLLCIESLLTLILAVKQSVFFGQFKSLYRLLKLTVRYKS